MKTLHVKWTNFGECQTMWHGIRPIVPIGAQMYVRCNKKGDVNWDKTSVYTAEELIERNNVVIIKPKKDGK